jgi:hypothetical protein
MAPADRGAIVNAVTVREVPVEDRALVAMCGRFRRSGDAVSMREHTLGALRLFDQVAPADADAAFRLLLHARFRGLARDDADDLGGPLGVDFQAELLATVSGNLDRLRQRFPGPLGVERARPAIVRLAGRGIISYAEGIELDNASQESEARPRPSPPGGEWTSP